MFIKAPAVEKPMDILTETEIDRIHGATLDVLEKTGVVFQSEEALEILHKGGCTVDSEKKLARFPRYLLKNALV